MTLCPFHRGHLLRISIHIPRVGDDQGGEVEHMSDGKISIHIPRVGDDENDARAKMEVDNFNPHPPCGG